MTATETPSPRVDSFLTGFFGAAIVVASVGIGFELGAAAAGSSIEPSYLAAMAGGAIASAGGLYRLRWQD